MMRQPDPMYQPPVVFQAQPTMEQLMAQVNLNTERVQSLESTGATLGLQGFPSIRAQIYMMPPTKFRMIGETALTGQLLDLGSNEQEFWVWGRGFDSPGLMYARHDEFQYSPVKTMLPVEPSWVAQAMGLAHFDPGDNHQGPYQTANGNYEIRTTLSSSAGPITKVTIIDRQYGYVVEQHLYDAAGQPVASALASNFRYDPSFSVTLPYTVDIRLPKSGADFTIQIIGYRINQLTEGTGTFAKPQRPDVPQINLASGAGMPMAAGQPLPSGQPLPGGQYSPQTHPTMNQAQPYPAQPYPTQQPPASGQQFDPYSPANTAPPVNPPQVPAMQNYPLGSNTPQGAPPASRYSAVRPVYDTAARQEFNSPPIRGMR